MYQPTNIPTNFSTMTAIGSKGIAAVVVATALLTTVGFWLYLRYNRKRNAAPTT